MQIQQISSIEFEKNPRWIWTTWTGGNICCYDKCDISCLDNLNFHINFFRTWVTHPHPPSGTVFDQIKIVNSLTFVIFWIYLLYVMRKKCISIWSFSSLCPCFMSHPSCKSDSMNQLLHQVFFSFLNCVVQDLWNAAKWLNWLFFIALQVQTDVEPVLAIDFDINDILFNT